MVSVTANTHDPRAKGRKRYRSCSQDLFFCLCVSVVILPLRVSADSASSAVSLTANPRDPPIIRSIMCVGLGGGGGGQYAALIVNNKSSSFVIWIGRKQHFFCCGGEREGEPLFQSKRANQSQLSPGKPPATRGVEGVGWSSACVCVWGGGADTLALVFLCLFRSHLDPSPLTSPSIGSFVASKVSPSLRLPPVVL